jgi:superoxide dismutase, Fe-Mn family
MSFKLEPLPYPYEALEPYIDKKTMEIHHSKHHQTYVDKLNAALEGEPELQKKSPEELVRNLKKVPEKIRQAVRNHGGGHLNHSFFWLMLKTGVEARGEIREAIEEEFKNFDNFKQEFAKAAMGLFGSGWTWLALDGKKLKIVSTANQDNPLTDGMTPLMGVDLWEHAYYLKHQNRRADYLSSFWSVVNWDRVNENYLEAMKAKPKR